MLSCSAGNQTGGLRHGGQILPLSCNPGPFMVLVGLCARCMHTHVHMCVHAVEARADAGCIPLLLSTLFSEAGSLTEPGAPHVC